jgi:hypothetical protein
MTFIFPECGDKLVFKGAVSATLVLSENGEGFWLGNGVFWTFDEWDQLKAKLERVERITACGWTTVWPRRY